MIRFIFSWLSCTPCSKPLFYTARSSAAFASPARLMTAYALLQRNPQPSEAEIRQALKDTLCRCAGYPTIIRAIQAAAESLRTGQPVTPPDFIPTSSLESGDRHAADPARCGRKSHRAGKIHRRSEIRGHAACPGEARHAAACLCQQHRCLQSPAVARCRAPS